MGLLQSIASVRVLNVRKSKIRDANRMIRKAKAAFENACPPVNREIEAVSSLYERLFEKKTKILKDIGEKREYKRMPGLNKVELEPDFVPTFFNELAEYKAPRAVFFLAGLFVDEDCYHVLDDANDYYDDAERFEDRVKRSLEGVDRMTEALTSLKRTLREEDEYISGMEASIGEKRGNAPAQDGGETAETLLSRYIFDSKEKLEHFRLQFEVGNLSTTFVAK